MSEERSDRIDQLEQKVHRLRFAVAALVVLGTGGLGFLGAARDADGTLQVREVVVEDEEGIVRARLGGNLPDAVVEGRRIDRGTDAAGLILYDDTGTERGGYVTFDENDNVLLTLDAGRGAGYGQTAYFIADSTGATAFRIWRGDDHVEMRAGSDGARFNAVRDGQVIFQRPEIEDPASTAMCTDLRQLQEQYGHDEVMNACRKRMFEEGCRACLERP